MVNPRVSIITATYNRPHLLERAIESVRAQTFTDWELIVVDDGDRESAAAAVGAWRARDSRIRYLSPGHRGRIAIISNIGLREARGEYVAILDDDDWWTASDKLEKQVRFLDTNSDHVGCGGGYVVVDEAGRETGRFLKPERHEDIVRHALIANPMANSTTLFRRATAERLGNYDETMLQFADWDFWLKMGLAGKLYNFPEHFAAYRMWEGGMSFAKQRENARSAFRIVRRYTGRYPRTALGCLSAVAYATYAYLPAFIKRFLNPALSRLKKFLFAGRGPA